MKELIILGKSDATISMISNILVSNNQYPKLIIVNNLNLNIEYPFQHEGIDYEVVTSMNQDYNNDFYFLGVSYPNVKKKILNEFKLTNSNFITIIHNTSSIAKTTKLGYGCLVNSLVSIDMFSEIGDFVTINRNVSIGHHTKVNNFVTINPGSNIAGHIVIGEGTTIGMGSNIINNVTIGKNVIIGAGSVVTKDIPDNVVAYGNPCKIIRENETQSV